MFGILYNDNKFETKPLRETVYKLNANEHLVFSPTPLTAQIKCRNGTHFPVFLSTTTKLFVPNGCETELAQHFIQSDFNIRVSPAALHFTWQIDLSNFPSDLLLSAAKIDNQMFFLGQKIANLQNNSIPLTKFDEMIQQHFTNPKTVPIVIWVLFSLFIIVMVAVVAWCVYNRWMARKYWQHQEALDLHPLDRALDKLNRDGTKRS